MSSAVVRRPLTTPQIITLNRMRRPGTKVVGATDRGEPIVQTPRTGARVAVLEDGRLALMQLPARPLTP